MPSLSEFITNLKNKDNTEQTVPQQTPQDVVDEAGSHVFVDQKTGLIITEEQYRAYNFSDWWKKYMGIVAIICFIVGAFLRLTVKNVMVIRKFSMFIMLIVPTLIVVAMYLIAISADKV